MEFPNRFQQFPRVPALPVAAAASRSISTDCTTCNAFSTFPCHRSYFRRSNSRTTVWRSGYSSAPSLVLSGRPFAVFWSTVMRIVWGRREGRPSRPPTPPCVRVRTRRFEIVELTSTEQRRETARAEVRVRERNRQRLRARQMPRTAATDGRFLRQCAAYTQVNQHRPAPTWSLPLSPERRPKAPSYPAGQLDQQVRRFAEPEIAAPTPHIRS